MWKIGDIKQKGLAAFKRNYWACVLVALVLGFTIANGGGGGGGSVRTPSSSSNSSNSPSWSEILEQFQNNDDDNNYNNDYNFDDFNIDDYEFDNYEDNNTDGGFIDLANTTSNAPVDNAAAGAIAASATIIMIVIIIAVIASLISIALKALLLNPLQVGCRKFFVENSAEPAKLGLMGSAFKGGNWKNTVWVMFTTNFFIGLWSLLFIIPGIIKAYEWLMVPYIVADDPTIDQKEARAISSKMMDGHKWNAFVLNLSFIGWRILGGFTCGLLNIFFTHPYEAAAQAELYVWMRSFNNPGGYNFKATPAFAGGYNDTYMANNMNSYDNNAYNNNMYNTGYADPYSNGYDANATAQQPNDSIPFTPGASNVQYNNAGYTDGYNANPTDYNNNNNGQW